MHILNLYPDGNGTNLKKEIASHENVPVNNIIIGNGSNEILELAARAFLNPSTSSIASKHAFAVYKIVTQSAGASLILKLPVMFTPESSVSSFIFEA